MSYTKSKYVNLSTLEYVKRVYIIKASSLLFSPYLGHGLYSGDDSTVVGLPKDKTRESRDNRAGYFGLGFLSLEAVAAPTNGVQRTHLNRFRRGRRREGEKERKEEY